MFNSSAPTAAYLDEAFSRVRKTAAVLAVTKANGTAPNVIFGNHRSRYEFFGRVFTWLSAHRRMSKEELGAKYPNLISDMQRQDKGLRTEPYYSANQVIWHTTDPPNLVCELMHKGKLGAAIDEVLHVA
jgi:hypothetical protein